MAENTKIEWAHHTFNPWIGCTKVSPACDHCYAEADFATRRKVVQWGAGQPRKLTADSTWAMPLRWNREAERLSVRYRVFCASLADVFDNEVPHEWRDDLATLILRTPHLDWLLLTKRIGNAGEMLGEMFLDGPPPNIRIGASITSQPEADRDIPKLLRLGLPNFISMEPLLGPVDLGLCSCDKGSRPGPGAVGGVACHLCNGAGGRMVDWVIVGGESGPNARPMHPDWARSLCDQCQASGVPFLFKQWGEWVEAGPSPRNARAIAPNGNTRLCEGTHSLCEALMEKIGKKAAGRLLDGIEHNGFPS
jgi:protein gp37